jgi:hypothetical protein
MLAGVPRAVRRGRAIARHDAPGGDLSGRLERSDAECNAHLRDWWTIGQVGNRPEHRHLFEGRKEVDLWHKLDEIAARVYL